MLTQGDKKIGNNHLQKSVLIKLSGYQQHLHVALDLFFLEKLTILPWHMYQKDVHTGLLHLC